MELSTQAIPFLKNNLWWIAPVVIVLPLVFLSGNFLIPSLSYWGTTSAWSLTEKILDRL